MSRDYVLNKSFFCGRISSLEEASSVDSSTGTQWIIYFQCNYSWVSYCAINISMEGPRGAPGRRGIRPLKSVSCYRAAAYPLFFFPLHPRQINIHHRRSWRALQHPLACTGNEHVTQYKYSADRSAMKFYTYRRVDRNRLARIVQTRDARTVNPDENKPDPRKAISGPISVIFWTVPPLKRCASDIDSEFTRGISAWLFAQYTRLFTSKLY